jgi:hypothetical protein
MTLPCSDNLGGHDTKQIFSPVNESILTVFSFCQLVFCGGCIFKGFKKVPRAGEGGGIRQCGLRQIRYTIA